MLKKYNKTNVFDASKERVEFLFNNFEKIYIAYSGGKDSTVMLHLIMDEALKRNRKVGVLIVDLEAQYTHTINSMEKIVDFYKENIELFWVALPISLRNAVSNYEPRWLCWDKGNKDLWVRQPSKLSITNIDHFPFFRSGMEFEEFVPLFGEWYSKGKLTACCVGIRADESLNRFRTIASKSKIRYKEKIFTTQIYKDVFNFYPIYDWKTSDLWLYHAKNPEKLYNVIYEYMYKAGLQPSQMRLCQPYGDDQRRGLWLYHLLEPATWYKLVNRVNGANSGSLYIQENGNITGYHKITKPENHTWESFLKLLLGSLPPKTRDHYIKKFRVFIKWWKARGYQNGLPQEAPEILEAKKMAPSYRRLCKTVLRNDYWCKGLGFTQPKSEAWNVYKRTQLKHGLGDRIEFEKAVGIIKETNENT